MARTMTDEQERDIFAACDNDWTYTEQTYRKWCQSLKAELDAERDAHNETNALLKGEIKAHALTLASIKRCDVCGEECSTVEGHAMKEELATLANAREADTERIGDLLNELASERAAHGETRRDAKLDHVTLTNRVQLRDDQIAALKERLKLAEAVCEWAEADTWTAGTPAWNALAAWRAGK